MLQGLSQYGNGFLAKFEAASCPSRLLEEITLVDTPGVLSGEKQRIERTCERPSAVLQRPPHAVGSLQVTRQQAWPACWVKQRLVGAGGCERAGPSGQKAAVDVISCTQTTSSTCAAGLRRAAI